MNIINYEPLKNCLYINLYQFIDLPVDNSELIQRVNEEIDQIVRSGEEIGGELLTIIGNDERVPAVAYITAALKLKNYFGAISVKNIEEGGFIVVHSTTPKHKLGETKYKRAA